jgi:nucleoid-associated protein YgaU
MKYRAILISAFLFAVIMAPAAFAMGGSAPETPKDVTAEVQTLTTEAKPVAATAETSSVKIVSQDPESELTSLEAQREKIYAFMEALNKKMIKAKTAGDTNKISELKAAERVMTDLDNKLGQKIIAIKQKHPELKPAEEAGVVIPEKKEKPGKPEEPKAVTSNIVYHEVMMGDTLMSISRKYFGTPAYFRDIAKMNKITDMAYLPQGTNLIIDLNMKEGKPGTAEATHKTAASAIKATPKPSTGGIVYYVVMPKDTLMSISRKFFNGSASYYKEIAQLNGIADLRQLKVGMKLKIDTGLKKVSKPSL